MDALNWIAVDWGTSHLRAWQMAGDQAQAQVSSSDGMGVLARDGFEPALLALIGPWLHERQHDGPVVPVIACGMVGSREGWAEAPYGAVPCTPLGQSLIRAPVSDPRLSVHIVPGLQQPRPADVMRGEETQIAGFLASHPGWDGVLCLPGTHSKWAHLSAGEVVSFQSFLTGEIFALLSRHSVLRENTKGWADEGFTDGLAEGIDRPERLMARLFSIRAEALLATRSPAYGRARLSGLLIGAEIANAKPYWLGQRVAVLGEDQLAGLYAQALATLHVPVSHHDASTMTLAGLKAAYDTLRNSEPNHA